MVFHHLSNRWSARGDGDGISSTGSCPGADVASVDSILSLGLLSGSAVGLEQKNIKKVPVQLTVYAANIADMGLY